ncbi:unnamed protein product [Eruca vesicaria subsp. sativa]|uniref:KIB1-4 beta-propeller domain-containing protein n=1 Tax=Eruca vesicaria subsp. sativa TaxID=29727 RepID=A0ABC8KXG6_ERUVS|nr:unnamed protein product [Eruca vesicaria subsp. sativa]
MGLLSLFQSGILKKLPRRRPGGLLERLLSSQIAQTPYLYLNEETVSLIYGDTEWDLAGRVVDTKLFDPRKEETVTLPNQVESSEELLGSQPIGSSRGWLALLTKGPDNESLPILLLTKKVVDCDNHLYTRLPSLPCCDSESILNVSLSSSSPEDDDDCIMAVKFLGPRFSFCRPALGEEAKWTHVYLRANQFDTSSMVYSNRHRKFCMTTQGSHYLAAWDLHTYPPVTTNYNNSWLTPLRLSN